MKRMLSAAAVAVLAAGFGASPAAAAHASPAHASPVLAPCAGLDSLPTARCGEITVPRDRAHPGKGTLTVGFALVPHTDTSKPSLGTIVPNPGGPGDSTIDLAGPEFAEALEPLMDRRDLLLIDTRGAGRSSPITCPALDGPAHVFEPLATQRRLIGECGRQLGDAVGDYSSTAVADDVDDVRAKLGIDRIDLLGVSYGTYLMATYAQRHPAHVRTVTLAGAYAVNVDTSGQVDANAFRRAVGLVCARTGKCEGQTVLSDLAAVLKRLRARPETVDVTFEGVTHHVRLDDWQLTSVAALVYESRPDTGKELALADAVARPDLTAVKDLVRDSLLASAENYTYGSTIYSYTQNWAVTCHDYQRDFSYADSVRQRTRDYDRVLSQLDDRDFWPFTASTFVTRTDYDSGACLDWPNDPTARSPFPAGARMPDVPVLVLSGDLDANTPIESGEAAAAQFPHAVTKVIEGAGHTPASTPEGVNDIIQFITTNH